MYKISVVPDKASVEVTDALALTQEDIENLTDQGFDEKTIQAVAQAVNEQLSSNANEEEDGDKTDRKSTTEPHLNAKHQTHNIDASNELNKTLTFETIDKNIHQTVQNQLEEQQEAQYEAFKQYLAKKNSEQTIDYRQVRINIESGALPTRAFYLLNGLAAIIAGFGLLAN